MVADFDSRVLIADGDMGFRQTLFSRLLEFDIFSDCVPSGTDALRKIEETRYTVAILDIALRGVDTLQVLQKIEEMDPRSRPVVLVLADHPEAARTLDVEIVQIILRKPVDIHQLAELVQSCVRSAARRAAKVVDTQNPAGDHATS